MCWVRPTTIHATPSGPCAASTAPTQTQTTPSTSTIRRPSMSSASSPEYARDRTRTRRGVNIFNPLPPCGVCSGGAGGCRSGEQGSAGWGAVASTSGGSARTGADGRATCRVSPVSSAESVEQPLARSPTSGSWIEFVPTPADTMPGGRSSGRPPPDAAPSRGCLGRELFRRLRTTPAARAVVRPRGAGSARADGRRQHLERRCRRTLPHHGFRAALCCCPEPINTLKGEFIA